MMEIGPSLPIHSQSSFDTPFPRLPWLSGRMFSFRVCRWPSWWKSPGGAPVLVGLERGLCTEASKRFVSQLGLLLALCLWTCWMWVWSLRQEDLLGEEMATHCSVLAWRIPLTEETSWLPSTGLQGVGHTWAWACVHTHTHTHTGAFGLLLCKKSWCEKSVEKQM